MPVPKQALKVARAIATISVSIGSSAILRAAFVQADV